MQDAGKANTINLAERRATTGFTNGLYAEGMALVEETAHYLEYEGRRISPTLSDKAKAFYAAESMRLTTRLMQIASWLLLQRAVIANEMTRDQATLEWAKIRLDMSSHETSSMWAFLPPEFKNLVDRSLRLQDRVRKLHLEVNEGVAAAEAPVVPQVDPNPVASQIARLNSVFGQ